MLRGKDQFVEKCRIPQSGVICLCGRRQVFRIERRNEYGVSSSGQRCPRHDLSEGNAIETSYCQCRPNLSQSVRPPRDGFPPSWFLRYTILSTQHRNRLELAVKPCCGSSAMHTSGRYNGNVFQVCWSVRAVLRIQTFSFSN